MPMPQINVPQAKSGGIDMGGVKVQLAQMHSARLETLGNMISQVKIAVGNQTVTQPLPQMPQGMKPGQQVQVSISTNKNGQVVIAFFPEQGKAPTASQSVKINLSDAQLVNLLSLNKNYKAAANGTSNSVMQTQAKVVLDNTNTPALKLPGLATLVKLPEGVAGLLKDSKTVAVAVTVKNNKVELQITLPGKAAKQAKISLPIGSEKISAIVKQSITKTADMPVSVPTKGSTTGKFTLPNQQPINLPGKVANNANVKVTNLNQHALTLKITPPQSESKPLAAMILNRTVINDALKQPASADGAKVVENKNQQGATSTTKWVNGSKAVLDPKGVISGKEPVEVKTAPNPRIIAESKILESKMNNRQAPVKEVATTAQAEALLAVQAKTVESYEQQKQVLSKLIDPLIRILLPKKLNWTEGLKSLATLEKQLPDSKSVPNADKMPSLKQVLNQLRASIPDQNTPLTEKNIASIVGQLLNFSPTKVMTSTQPTPGNAIASALQLLLGSKAMQSESKATPQLLQQLTALLKPLTGKQEKTPKGIKAMTASMAQAEQSSGSLKTLVGLHSGIRNQQLDNVEKKLDGNAQINLTVPLKVNDEVKELHIAINEDEEKSDKDGRKTSLWQLNLTFDLGELGRLLVNAKLKEGEVNMHLYAEQQKTLTLMNKFSAVLEQRLEFHGVKIKNIQSSLGKIGNAKTKRQLNSLLQIKV
ncbi:MAG: flagellar hook-length control protein FliK [Algicola sp.]|nr:flagellar hook-length control protein FliK [Algicola sp.]